MSQIYKQSTIFDVILSGSVSAGDVVQLGSLAGIAISSGVSGDTIAAEFGVQALVPVANTFTCNAGDALAISSGKFIKPATAGDYTIVAYALEAVSAGVTEIKVYLSLAPYGVTISS